MPELKVTPTLGGVGSYIVGSYRVGSYNLGFKNCINIERRGCDNYEKS